MVQYFDKVGKEGFCSL